MFYSTFHHLKPHWKYLLACLTTKYACSFGAGTKLFHSSPCHKCLCCLSPMFCTAEKIAQPVFGKERSREEGIKRTGQRQKWDRHLYRLYNTWTLRSSLGEGAVRRGEHSYPQRELTQERRVLTVPQAPEDSGAGASANKEPCYIAKAGKKKVSTYDCKVNSRKQPGVWKQQSVCKGLKNEWVEGNERFKTFGSRLMKWREKGPPSSSEKWGLTFFFLQEMIPSHHVTDQIRTFDFLFTTPESPE